MRSMRITVLSFVGAVLISMPILAQASVLLGGAANPPSGQAGETSVTVTGSGFPSGTISPASVTVTLTPRSGGSAVTSTASSVTFVKGTTNTIGFLIPASISVSTPTVYQVAISGATTGGTGFQSSNSSLLTINPPEIRLISPTKGIPGQTVSVTIYGLYTNFASGVTQANFGPDIAVGGAAAGANGPVSVVSATKAVASIVISETAALGSRNIAVVTGTQTATLANGFSVAETTVLLSAATSPSSGQAGETSISVTGSGFPSGTISSASVTVTLTPRSGGSPVTTTATSVTPGSGSK